MKKDALKAELVGIVTASGAHVNFDKALKGSPGFTIL